MGPKAKSAGSTAAPRRRSSSVASGRAAKAQPRALPAAPKEWPPRVPFGSIEDVLPLIAADDDSFDTLMLGPPQAQEGGSAALCFGPDECEYMCGCLRKNTTVTHLNVSFHAVGDRGAAHIAELIGNAQGPRLSRLELNSCDIGGAGAVALAEALIASQSLQVVELMSNRIDDEGGQALLEMLKKNRHVKQLSVSFNHISEGLQEQIDKQLLMR